ncbi:universal stress protein (plasmid) [Embleya sp. NBC_00888]|uniref:universal stress protein n=1 Tax=Embleya sp. NBC_00888 TaxID=2975960 RepID=UPI002F90C66B|nr:universal stress protein [Embleya sp. NBC_00888]
MTFTGTIPDLGVLVGYDGSPGGERALAWAARTAADAKTPLYIAMAIPSGSLGHRKDAVPLRAGARQLVETAAAAVRDTYPHLVVETTLPEGPAADVILETGRRAGLIVVGSRGHGGFVGLVLGSVSLRVCAQATCPVVVVPESVSTAGHKDIVVGVADGAPTAAVDFAVAQARRTGGDVIALRAWTLPLTAFGPGLVPPVIDDTEQIADGQRTLLDDILRPVRARAHDVAIESVVRTGSAASELIELAAAAALVVVSAHRGRSAFPMRIGPTTHAVLHHAPCPVAVVPVPHESRG